MNSKVGKASRYSPNEFIVSQCTMIGNGVLQSDFRCHHNISQVCEGGIQDECINTSEIRNGLVIPAEEVNRVKSKGEIVMHQHVSEITMNNMKHEDTELCWSNHYAGTLVMEAGPEDNVAIDCSEGAFNGDGNNTAVTVCCINWALGDYENPINSEEEICAKITSKELKANFREIRPFVSEDDGSSHNELALGYFSSEKGYFGYGSFSFNTKMVGNSELVGTSAKKTNSLGPCKNSRVVDNHDNAIEYANPTYPVLIGKSTKVYPTNPFASLPRCDKFLVEKKLHDPISHGVLHHQPLLCYDDDDDDNNDDDVMSAYCRQNYNSPGQILYTIICWPERSNIHSILKQKSVLPMFALKGGNHDQYHCGKFLFFFMDHDTRKLVFRDVRCFHQNYSKQQLMRWEKGFNYTLGEMLEALAYLHSNKYVHRDFKASNIMIKMRCHCRPLECTCSSRFQVKLGDFDSAGTVPGLGITEPTDQVIKFASILPLGTPGYRAPEVSMHITLSGPYETLYTTAVDMWSFGCLCLNICIGKTAALKQREETSLLLSRTHTCSTKLWERTTKLKKPRQQELIRLVGDILHVLIDFLQGA